MAQTSMMVMAMPMMACSAWRDTLAVHSALTLATEDQRLDQHAWPLADRTGAAVFGEAHDRQQSTAVSVRCHFQNASTVRWWWRRQAGRVCEMDARCDDSMVLSSRRCSKTGCQCTTAVALPRVWASLEMGFTVCSQGMRQRLFGGAHGRGRRAPEHADSPAGDVSDTPAGACVYCCHPERSAWCTESSGHRIALDTNSYGGRCQRDGRLPGLVLGGFVRIGRLPEGFDSCTVKSECRSSGDGDGALLLRAVEDNGDSQQCSRPFHPNPSSPPHQRPAPSSRLLPQPQRCSAASLQRVAP